MYVWILHPGWQVMFTTSCLSTLEPPSLLGIPPRTQHQTHGSQVLIFHRFHCTRTTATPVPRSLMNMSSWKHGVPVAKWPGLVILSLHTHTPETIRSDMSEAKRLTETNSHSNQCSGAGRTSGRRVPALWVLNVSRRGRNTCSRRWRCLAGQTAFFVPP